MYYTSKDIQAKYEDITGVARCRCTFLSEMVGGQPADLTGIKNYITYQMKVPEFLPPVVPGGEPVLNQEFTDLFERIRGELGEREVTPEAGELKEKIAYSVNAIRRDENGPYLGDWMVKACIKAAASRLNLFVAARGSKGDVAEAGRVRAYDLSLVGDPFRIYIRNADLTGPAETEYKKFAGKVNSGMESRSIMHDSEVAVSGSRFAFEFRFLPSRFAEEDILRIMALAGIVGLGSARALERGKFQVDGMEIDLTAATLKGAAEKKEKPPKVTKDKPLPHATAPEPEPVAMGATSNQSAPHRH